MRDDIYDIPVKKRRGGYISLLYLLLTVEE